MNGYMASKGLSETSSVWSVNGHYSLANGSTPEERLEGLHFEIADWHGGNKVTEVGK